MTMPLLLHRKCARLLRPLRLLFFFFFLFCGSGIITPAKAGPHDDPACDWSNRTCGGSGGRGGECDVRNGILKCSGAGEKLPCDPTEPSLLECEAIPVKTLDDLLAEVGTNSVDVVKMDVEGFECSVLRGGQSLFEKFRVKFLQAETKQPEVAKCFAKEAAKHGYTMGPHHGHDGNRVIAPASQAHSPSTRTQ